MSWAEASYVVSQLKSAMAGGGGGGSGYVDPNNPKQLAFSSVGTKEVSGEVVLAYIKGIKARFETYGQVFGQGADIDITLSWSGNQITLAIGGVGLNDVDLNTREIRECIVYYYTKS